MPPLLEVRDLTRRFTPRGAAAVEGLGFDVERGEILALLGPSGCGKTTALRLVGGFERPERGRVVMEGRTLSENGVHVPPEARGIGFVFQEFALFPHLDVQGNVEFGLGSLPRAKRRDRALETLDLVGLEDLKHRRVHDLSGGEQQRVALARTLAPGPRLVLLDEPFSSLDEGLRASTRREVRALFRDLGMTAVLVTHDQEEALTFADRIGVMCDGRLVQVGTPEEIYSAPGTPFVAEFLGRTNLIPARARGLEAESALGLLRLERPAEGDVLLSLRPEHIGLEAPADGETTATVVNREFKGHDLTLRVDREGRSYVVQTDYTCRFTVGSKVRLVARERAVVVEGGAPSP